MKTSYCRKQQKQTCSKKGKSNNRNNRIKTKAATPSPTTTSCPLPSLSNHAPVFIKKTTKTDIVLGRGNGIGKRSGNCIFRDIIKSYKNEYVNAARRSKISIAEKVIHEVKQLDPPARFLERCDETVRSSSGGRNSKKKNNVISGGVDDASSIYVEIDMKRSLDKVCQALREKQYVQKRTSMRSSNTNNFVCSQQEKQCTTYQQNKSQDGHREFGLRGVNDKTNARYPSSDLAYGSHTRHTSIASCTSSYNKEPETTITLSSLLDFSNDDGTFSGIVHGGLDDEFSLDLHSGNDDIYYPMSLDFDYTISEDYQPHSVLHCPSHILTEDIEAEIKHNEYCNMFLNGEDSNIKMSNSLLSEDSCDSDTGANTSSKTSAGSLVYNDTGNFPNYSPSIISTAHPSSSNTSMHTTNTTTNTTITTMEMPSLSLKEEDPNLPSVEKLYHFFKYST